mmetsp:Transcript_22193/g.29688  ORF Transcript_22193/g.29688 Transcript_22193/m.29688 type:complete len:158 (+) Transcript_22193:1058-1531(+)
MKFILGVESIEGKVIDQRIKDVMAMGAKKNQTYKPRQGGTNRNLKNYTTEQIEYTKNYNEELFHVFGYVKDDERLPNNVTPFMDFEGQASPKSVEKTNYYRKLNEIAMEKRMRMRGGIADQDNKIHVGPGIDGGIRLVTEMQVLKNIGVTDHIEFAH